MGVRNFRKKKLTCITAVLGILIPKRVNGRIQNFITFGCISVAVLSRIVKLQKINLLKHIETNISAILEIAAFNVPLRGLKKEAAILEYLTIFLQLICTYE